MYYRIVPIYWEGNIFENNTYINHGIDKGIFVKKEKYDMYEKYYYELRLIPNNKNVKVLFASEKTYLYLMGEWTNSCFSPWSCIYFGGYVDKLDEYYQINKDKIPDYIFVESDYDFNYFKKNLKCDLVSVFEEGNMLYKR